MHYGHNALTSASVCDEEDTEYYLNQSDRAYEVAKIFQDHGLKVGLWHFKAFNDEFLNEPAEELLDDYGINLDLSGHGLNEEDDMFAKSKRADLRKINTQSLRQLHHMSFMELIFIFFL